MTIAEIKGHLIARRANLETEARTETMKMLQLQHQLKAVRQNVAGLDGSIQELDRTLELVEKGISHEKSGS